MNKKFSVKVVVTGEKSSAVNIEVTKAEYALLKDLQYEINNKWEDDKSPLMFVGDIEE